MAAAGLIPRAAMVSPAFESLVAPARARPQLWRLAAGLAMSALIYGAVTVAIFAAVWLAMADPDPELGWIDEIIEADTPRAMLILLATFAGMALGPMAAARLLHHRPGGTLFGRAPVVLRDFVTAAAVAGAVLACAVLAWLILNDPVAALPVGTWAALLPLSLLAVLVQTGAEEVLFRGYIQQQLAARFRSPVIWAVLPAAVFGLLHYDPASAGDNAWLMVGAAGLFGLLAADLTARTGSLGAAWGFHFANNTVALVLIATEGTLTGLALFRTPYDVSDTEAIRASIPVDLAVMLLIWLLLRRILGRR